MQERFVTAYRAAGGDVQLELFADMSHGIGSGAPGTDRIGDAMRSFIQRQLAA